MLAGDSGGNRFNHGESQPPSRPGTSSGKAETELSLTRDLAHGRNLGLGQCHERREHAEKISPRPRPLTRPHGPGVATIASVAGARCPGGCSSGFCQLGHNFKHHIPATHWHSSPGPGPLQSTWLLVSPSPARPSNMFCAATTSSGFYHHEILFNTCPVPGWLLAAYVTPSHCNSS